MIQKQIEATWAEAIRNAGGGNVAPVTFVNEVDNEQLPKSMPPDFKYLEAEFELEKGIEDAPTLRQAKYSTCDCKNECDVSQRGVCECSEALAYDAKGLVRPSLLLQKEPIKIVECNRRCTCASTCPNRASQQPRSIPIEIFKTKFSGWGVRAREAIPMGKVLGFFTGKLISGKRARDLELAREAKWKQASESPASDSQIIDQRHYIFDIIMEGIPDLETGMQDELDRSIDAWGQGNWTRFINHSCDPVLRGLAVTIEPMLPRHAYVALQDIPEGTELTINYEDQVQEERPVEHSDGPGNPQPCRCGAKSCRGWVGM